MTNKQELKRKIRPAFIRLCQVSCPRKIARKGDVMFNAFSESGKLTDLNILKSSSTSGLSGKIKA